MEGEGQKENRKLSGGKLTEAVPEKSSPIIWDGFLYFDITLHSDGGGSAVFFWVLSTSRDIFAHFAEK